MAITKKICPICKKKYRFLYMLPSKNKVYYYNACFKCHREITGTSPVGGLCRAGGHPNE